MAHKYRLWVIEPHSTHSLHISERRDQERSFEALTLFTSKEIHLKTNNIKNILIIIIIIVNYQFSYKTRKLTDSVCKVLNLKSQKYGFKFLIQCWNQNVLFMQRSS